MRKYQVRTDLLGSSMSSRPTLRHVYEFVQKDRLHYFMIGLECLLVGNCCQISRPSERRSNWLKRSKLKEFYSSLNCLMFCILETLCHFAKTCLKSDRTSVAFILWSKFSRPMNEWLVQTAGTEDRQIHLKVFDWEGRSTYSEIRLCHMKEKESRFNLEMLFYNCAVLRLASYAVKCIRTELTHQFTIFNLI